MNLFNNKKLEPYGFLDITLSNDMLKNLLEKRDQITRFFVFDTVGKEWKPNRKVMKEFIASLKEQVTSNSPLKQN